MNVFIGLVPHAGQEYAGRARQSVFDELTSTIGATTGSTTSTTSEMPLIVYYLATIHHPLSAEEMQYHYAFVDSTIISEKLGKSGKSRKSLLSWSSPPRWPENTINDRDKFPPTLQQEHSYNWVAPELKEALRKISRKVEYRVIFPHAEDKDLWFKWLMAEVGMVDKVGAPRNILILATTDLIHYGPQYGQELGQEFKLAFPQQLGKIKLEAPLLEALIEGNTLLLEQTLALTPFVADSPHVLSILTNIVSWLKRRGKVVDYYDSSAIVQPLSYLGDSSDDEVPVHNVLDLYTISWKPVTTFVSYVGMVWHTTEEKGQKKNYGPKKFDVLQALGAVRSVIALDTLQSSAKEFSKEFSSPLDLGAIFPSWSSWRKPQTSEFGVFVGTEVADAASRDTKKFSTNCSYGRFPGEGKSGSSDSFTLADKIIAASKNCWEDAADRWMVPYTLDDFETFGKLKFKVELLMPKKTWRWVAAGPDGPLQEIIAGMFAQGDSPVKHYLGVQLVIPSIGSATFLPVVAKEYSPVSSSFTPDTSAKALAKDYLSSLSRKLGGKSSDWMRTDAMGGLYKTIAFYWNDKRQTIDVV